MRHVILLALKVMLRGAAVSFESSGFFPLEGFPLTLANEICRGRLDMKVTVELNDEDRAQLLTLAAQDPDKGLAELVGEAIELFIASHSRESSRHERVDRLRGCLSDEETEAFSEALGTIRSSWR